MGRVGKGGRERRDGEEMKGEGGEGGEEREGWGGDERGGEGRKGEGRKGKGRGGSRGGRGREGCVCPEDVSHPVSLDELSNTHFYLKWSDPNSKQLLSYVPFLGCGIKPLPFVWRGTLAQM